MKVKVYFTLNQYQQWKRGEEVTVNNLNQEIGKMPSDPKTDLYETKIEAFISEDEVLEVGVLISADDYKRNILFYEYTIKKKQ